MISITSFRSRYESCYRELLISIAFQIEKEEKESSQAISQKWDFESFFGPKGLMSASLQAR